MNFNFRKIGSVIASAVMLGSTLGLAAANYPAPFVKNGAADVAVVWGSNAANTDLAAVVDITTSLQTELAKQTATTGSATSSTTTGGDAVLIEKSSTKWQLGDTLTEVRSTDLDDNDMDVLLADGVYTDDDNDEFDFKQSISPAALSLSMFDNDDYKVDTPTLGIEVTDGAEILNYTIDFTEEPLWVDVETTDIPILGKNYYVLDTANNNSITLLDSADSVIIAEGETKTLTVGNKTYEVSVDFVSSTPNAKLIVNGQSTNSLANGQTQKLSDGAYVGVKEVLYTSKDTGSSKVELSIGSGKLTLTNADEVQMNDEDIDNLVAWVANTTDTKLNSITLQWKADDDMFVTEDSSITMPGFESVKVSFAGMIFPKEEVVVAKADGDNNFVLENFPTKYTVEDVYLLESNGTNFTIIGKDSNNKVATSHQSQTLTFTEGTHDYFVLSYMSGDDAESYFVRATNFDDSTTPDQVDFEYLSEGTWKSLDTGVVATNELTLGSAAFTVATVSNEATKTVTITVSGNNYLDKLYSEQGLAVQLPWTNVSTVNVTTQLIGTCANTNVTGAIGTQAGVGQMGYTITVINNTDATGVTCTHAPGTYDVVFKEEDKDDAIANGGNVTVAIGLDSESEVYVTGVTTVDTNGATVAAAEIGDTDVYLDYVYSDLATKVEDDRGGDHEKVTLTYHGDEVYGQVYITDMSATITPGTGSSGSVKELGKVSLTDAQVSSVSGKNLIVVGGSCVNTVAAQLLDGTGCGDSFTTKTGVGNNQFLIQTFARTDGKVATLVAGYNAVDTTNAATYLTTQQVDTTVGKKYIGTSATSATLQTTATA